MSRVFSIAAAACAATAFKRSIGPGVNQADSFDLGTHGASDDLIGLLCPGLELELIRELLHVVVDDGQRVYTLAKLEFLLAKPRDPVGHETQELPVCGARRLHADG